MFIRNRMHYVDLVGNESYSEVSVRENLYADAFPFNAASAGEPAPIAFVAIHGSAPAVPTGFIDMWGQNIVRTMPTSPFTVAVSSGSTDDVNTSGNGAWKVQVDILVDDYVMKTITLNLNGQNKVVDTTYVGRVIRVNDVRVIATGVNLVNAGAIYVYDSTDTVVLGVPQDTTKIFHRIMLGEVVARGAFFTVPKGCKLQTQQVRAGITDAVNTNRFGSIQLKASTLMSGRLVPRAFPISGQIGSGMGLVEVNPDFPLVFPEKSDLSMQAQCSATAVMASYMDAILFYAQ